jgi:cyclopropane fatty-acyl-phospholipid synthase-like methyltransferase
MKRDFDADAATWDQNTERLQMAMGVAQAMAGHLQLDGSEVVLDYGTGTGVVGLRLAALAKQVICADSSRGMLDVLDGKIQSSGLPNVQTLLLDLELVRAHGGLPALDVVVSSMAMHHIADTRALLKTFFDLLKPAGRVALADLDTEPGDFHADNTGVEHFGFDRGELAALAAEVGFAQVASSTAYRMLKTTAAGIQREFPIFLLTGRRPA